MASMLNGGMAGSGPPSPTPRDTTPKRASANGRRKVIALLAAFALVLALVIAAIVSSSGDTSNPEEAGRVPQTAETDLEETDPSATDESVEVSTTTLPTEDEIATSFIQGQFIGEFEETLCSAEGLTNDDGGPYTCEHPNELIFNNSGSPTVNVLNYTIPVTFDGSAWTTSVAAPSAIPNCDGGGYMVVVELSLRAVDASPSTDSPTGWMATRLEGSLTERSIPTKTTPDCPPYASSRLLLNFTPPPAA